MLLRQAALKSLEAWAKPPVQCSEQMLSVQTKKTARATDVIHDERHSLISNLSCTGRFILTSKRWLCRSWAAVHAGGQLEQ